MTESVLLVREMLPLIRAKGGRPGPAAKLLSRLPAGLVGFVLQKFLGADTLYSFLTDQLDRTGHLDRESGGLYARDVLADARKLGVPLPRLAALEPVFSLR